jgi:mRNA interferase MazF
MPQKYIPERGDFVWIEFSPQVGHEQGGRRPALVVTPRYYNQQSGLMLACPITNQIKGYPFEVAVPESSAIGGAVLVDQIKCLDWHERPVKLIGQAPLPVLEEVLAKLDVLVKK